MGSSEICSASHRSGSTSSCLTATPGVTSGSQREPGVLTGQSDQVKLGPRTNRRHPVSPQEKAPGEGSPLEDSPPLATRGRHLEGPPLLGASPPSVPPRSSESTDAPRSGKSHLCGSKYTPRQQLCNPFSTHGAQPRRVLGQQNVIRRGFAKTVRRAACGQQGPVPVDFATFVGDYLRKDFQQGGPATSSHLASVVDRVAA